MLFADDAGVVSRSAEGLARLMTVVVEVFVEFGLTVSEEKTETLEMKLPIKRAKEGEPQPSPPPPPLVVEAAEHRYSQTTEFRCLGGRINEEGELTREINHRGRAALGVRETIWPGAVRSTGSTAATQGPFITSGGDGGFAVRLRGVVPTEIPQRPADNDTLPTAPTGYRVSPPAWNLSTAVVRPGSQNRWVPMCRSHGPTTPAALCGGGGETVGGPTSKANDVGFPRGEGEGRGAMGKALDGLPRG